MYDNSYTWHQAAINPSYQLISKHKHSLQAEPSVAEIEQVFKTGAKQVYHHHVVVSLHPIPSHVGDAHCNNEGSAHVPCHNK